MTSTATDELDALRRRQAMLAERVSQVDAEQRTATAAATVASDALVDLERRSAAGEKVTAADRRRAEDDLLQARTAAAAPWSERRKAGTLAPDDARRDVAAFVAANLDALLNDLDADGERAVEAVNAAAEAVIAAAAARADVERRVFDLLSTVQQVRPGDVERSRSEAFAAEARKVLAQGGEQPPAVLVRPGDARHAVPA